MTDLGFWCFVAAACVGIGNMSLRADGIRKYTRPAVYIELALMVVGVSLYLLR